MASGMSSLQRPLLAMHALTFLWALVALRPSAIMLSRLQQLLIDTIRPVDVATSDNVRTAASAIAAAC